MTKFRFKMIYIFFMLTFVNISSVVGVQAMEKNNGKTVSTIGVYNKNINKTSVLKKDENTINKIEDSKKEIIDETFSKDNSNRNFNILNKKKSDNNLRLGFKKFNKNFKYKNTLNIFNRNKRKKFDKNFGNNLSMIFETSDDKCFDDNLSEISKKSDNKDNFDYEKVGGIFNINKEKKADDNSSIMSEKSDDRSIKIFKELDKSFDYSFNYNVENPEIINYWNEFYFILMKLKIMNNVMDSKISKKYDSLCWRCNEYIEKNIKNISDKDLNTLNSIITEINNRVEYSNYYNVKDKISEYRNKLYYILTQLENMPNIITNNIKEKYDSLRYRCIDYVEKNVEKIDKNKLDELSAIINEIDRQISTCKNIGTVNNMEFYFKPINHYNEYYNNYAFKNKYEKEDYEFYSKIYNNKNNWNEIESGDLYKFSYEIYDYYLKFSDISSKFSKIVNCKSLVLDKKLYYEIEEIKKEYEELRKKYYYFISDNINEFFKNNSSKELIAIMDKKIGDAISKIYELFPNEICFTEYFDSYYEFHSGPYKDFIFYLKEFEKNFKKMIFKSLSIERSSSSRLIEIINDVKKEYNNLVKNYKEYINNNGIYFNLNDELSKKIHENIFNFQQMIEQNIVENEEIIK